MSSHRKIKPELISDHIINEVIESHIEPEKVHHKKPEHKPSKGFMRKNKLKKVFQWTLKTIAGENKFGEGLHGILDLLPIPNQVFAKSASYFVKEDKHLAKRELKKLVSVRNAIAVVAFILFATGIMTIQDVISLLRVLGEFL